MTAVTAREFTAEERAERRTGIGGSDAAAICGLDRYRSPYVVWLEKTGQLEPAPAGEAALWGQLLEEPVAAEFARRRELTVVAAPPMVRHDEHAWLFANVDRDIVEEPAFVEVKTTGEWTARLDWEDGPPLRVQVQGQHYCAVRNCTHFYVAALVGGQRFESWRIERDDHAIAQLLTIEERFWQQVVDGTPPAIDGTSSTRDALHRLFDTVEEGKRVVLDPEVVELLDRRARAKADIKAAESVCAEVENQVKAMLGDAEEAWLDGSCVVTWKHFPETPVAASVRKAYRRFNVKAGAR